MTRTIYLKSYDLYREILEYRLPEGKSTILAREEFEARGLPVQFGSFSREGERVAGVFASPEGPVFFMDSQYVVGRFGHAIASTAQAPGQSLRHYSFAQGESFEFELTYKDRPGIGTNPYDNELEDVDLFAMIATGVRHEAFYRAYTREWVECP